MAVTYRVLTQDEMDDMIAQTLLGLERDHFSHSANFDRYTSMLAAVPVVADPGDVKLSPVERERAKFTARIAELIVTEEAALRNVSDIIEHTLKQLPDQTALDAAVARIRAREGR